MNKMSQNVSALIITVGVLAAFASRAADDSRAMQSSTMSDAQIAAMLKDANTAEIGAAKLAKSRARNGDVKEFAKMMLNDHRDNLKQEKALDKKIGLKPKGNSEETQMRREAAVQTENLRRSPNAKFDKAYIDMQVSMHQRLLSDLDSKLIPAAQNPELKSFLEETKQHVQAHLDRAQQIQTALK